MTTTDPSAAAARRALAAQHCKPGAARLSAAETDTQLRALPGWTLEGDAIEKTFRFADYAARLPS
jgi:hypothetical protein